VAGVDPVLRAEQGLIGDFGIGQFGADAELGSASVPLSCLQTGEVVRDVQTDPASAIADGIYFGSVAGGEGYGDADCRCTLEAQGKVPGLVGEVVLMLPRYRIRNYLEGGLLGRGQFTGAVTTGFAVHLLIADECLFQITPVLLNDQCVVVIDTGAGQGDAALLHLQRQGSQVRLPDLYHRPFSI